MKPISKYVKNISTSFKTSNASGTENEVYFNATKTIKRERFKWIAIVMLTNCMTALLFMSEETIEVQSPWPKDWVEVEVQAQMIAAGAFPRHVSIVNQNSVTIKEAYVLRQSKECERSTVIMKVNPMELSKLQLHQKYDVYPFHADLSFHHSKKVTEKNYEVRF